MKLHTLVGLSILMASSFSFADTCKEDLKRICSTCKYEDICDAIEDAKYDWESGSALHQCIQKTINSMSPEYFAIQYKLEYRDIPAPTYNNNNYNYGGSSNNGGSSRNNNYSDDFYDNGKYKHDDFDNSGKFPDMKFNASEKKEKQKSVLIINGTNYSDGTDRGSVKNGNQSGQGTSGQGNGSNSGNDGKYQNYQDYKPSRIQGFADKIVRDCEKDFKAQNDRSRTKVKVVGETNFHSSMSYSDTKTLIGGLSGLTRLKDKDGKLTQELLAVSDDKNLPTMVQVKFYEDPVMDPAKPFKFKITKRLSMDRLYQEYNRQEPIYDKDKPNAPPKYRTVKEKWPVDIDREDVVLLPNGNILVSSETGDIKTYDGTPAKPLLFQEFTLDGKLVGGLPSPVDFVSEYKSTQKAYDCTPPPPPPEPKKSDFDSKGNGGSGSGTGTGSGFGPSTTPNPPPPPPKSQTTFSAANDVLSPLMSESDRNPCGEKSKKGEKKTCYWTETKRVGGLDFNKGIEAMTIVPTTDEVLFTNESPLVQDEPERGFWGTKQEEDYVRMYTVRYGSWAQKAPVKYYKYPMRKDYDNGVPAILALDSSRVLVLERGYDSFKKEAVVKLYKVELADAERNGNLHKELIVDFDDLKPQFAAGFKKIDNFEGMALGPVKDGKQIIFLVSDNNFNAVQRTTFLALAIPQEALK